MKGMAIFFNGSSYDDYPTVESPLLLLLLTVIVSAIYLCYSYACRPRCFPPGPKPYPFIGNLNLSINNARFHQTLCRLAAEYGGLFGLQMGWYPVIVISDLEMLKDAVLGQPDVFNDRPRDLPYFKLLFKGNGIILQNGETWKTLRKVTISSLREFGMGRDSIETSVQQEAQRLLGEVEKHVGKPLKVQTMFHKAVSNIICSILFGKRFEYDDKDYESLVAGLDFMFSTGGFQNPYLFLPVFTYVTMPFTQPIVFESIKQLRSIKQFIANQIEDHRTSFDPSHLRDFVDLYLEAERSEQKSTVFTEGNMFQVILDLFMAGTETISQTMKWAFFFLLKHPEVQDKCRDELMKVIGDSRIPNLNDRAEMPYTEATISEIQRFTVSLGVLHNTSRAVEMGGYTIPQNTVVITNLHAVHMDSKYWDNPGEFRPERFLDEQNRHHRPPAFVAFGLGKRGCPGENLVIQELFIFLTSLLQQYNFTSTVEPSQLPGHEQAVLGITLEAPDYEIMASKL